MMLAVMQVLIGLGLVLIVVLNKQIHALRAASQVMQTEAMARLDRLEREIAEMRVVLGLPPRATAHHWERDNRSDGPFD